MYLTEETRTFIKEGDVVRFYSDKDPNSTFHTGVIYCNDEVGIFANREDGSHFIFFAPSMFDMHFKFEILKEHAPVEIINGRYNFVK